MGLLHDTAEHHGDDRHGDGGHHTHDTAALKQTRHGVARLRRQGCFEQGKRLIREVIAVLTVIEDGTERAGTGLEDEAQDDTGNNAEGNAGDRGNLQGNCHDNDDRRQEQHRADVEDTALRGVQRVGELDHAGHIRIAAVILHHTENAEEDQGDGVGDAGGQDHGLDVGDNVRTGHGGSEVRRIGQRAHLIAEVGAGEDGTGSHAGAHAKAEANAHQGNAHRAHRAPGRTGVKLDVLSNSEQRFLDYKSIASRGGFEKIIEKGTLVLDIGGGSIQMSLFDKDKLSATQNMRLGVLRLQEKMSRLNVRPSENGPLLEELLEAQLSVFRKMYLKDRVIENIIVVDDYISALILGKLGKVAGSGYLDRDSMASYMNYLHDHTDMEIVRYFDTPEENVPLLRISSAIVRQVALMTDAKMIWAPGVSLCDGMVYEYAEEYKLLAQVHDFEQDIVTCARGISKRYMGSKRRAETLEQIALTIFDSMKRVHGMGRRERLLLRIATLLHDCGKYISMVNLGECSYAIIMATEIIGLSHREREIVANIVRYNHLEFDYSMENSEGIDREEYLTIVKLTAILQIANALDRSHKQKCRDIKAVRKDDKLILTITTNEDITLERGLFGSRAEFFREVYSIEPVIRQKRIL